MMSAHEDLHRALLLRQEQERSTRAERDQELADLIDEDRVRLASLTNNRLRALTARFPAPQSWYDETWNNEPSAAP